MNDGVAKKAIYHELKEKKGCQIKPKGDVSKYVFYKALVCFTVTCNLVPWISYISKAEAAFALRGGRWWYDGVELPVVININSKHILISHLIDSEGHEGHEGHGGQPQSNWYLPIYIICSLVLVILNCQSTGKAGFVQGYQTLGTVNSDSCMLFFLRHPPLFIDIPIARKPSGRLNIEKWSMTWYRLSTF